MNKVYIIQLEYRLDGCTEFEIMGTFSLMSEAQKEFNYIRDNLIVGNWTNGNNEFEIESNTETKFEYQYDNWDEYYILTIVEKYINKKSPSVIKNKIINALNNKRKEIEDTLSRASDFGGHYGLFFYVTTRGGGGNYWAERKEDITDLDTIFKHIEDNDLRNPNKSKNAMRSNTWDDVVSWYIEVYYAYNESTQEDKYKSWQGVITD